MNELARAKDSLHTQTETMRELEQQNTQLTESLKRENAESKAKDERMTRLEDVETQLMIAEAEN